jgi:hypothetical protein
MEKKLIVCEVHGEVVPSPKTLCFDCYLDSVNGLKQKVDAAHVENEALKARVAALEKELDYMQMAAYAALSCLSGVGRNGGPPSDSETRKALDILKVRREKAKRMLEGGAK